MRKTKILLLGLIPPLIMILGIAFLADQSASAQSSRLYKQLPSSCEVGLQKSVAPAQLQPGDTAKVTMIMTHTCPAYRKPVDLVFLVDVSTSMTRDRNARSERGGNDDPTDPPNDPPGNDPPPPVDPPLVLRMPGIDFDSYYSEGSGIAAPDQQDDPPEPGAGNDAGVGGEPSGCGQTNEPRDNGGGGLATPTPPGPPPPPGPGNDPGPGVPPGGGDNRGEDDPDAELPGTEDLIRDAQQFIRKFVNRADISDDIDNNRLRLGLVSFNDRGRRLVSLSNEYSRRVGTRVSLLRGGDKTRIDLGMRKAEQVLLDRNRRTAVQEDRIKVLVIISDGQFCSKDLRRARVDKNIIVVTVAAGRRANVRNLQRIASDRGFVYTTRELDELLDLYYGRRNHAVRENHQINVQLPNAMEELTIREILSDNMTLVGNSANPVPASVSGQEVEWAFPNPSETITIEFDIEPMEQGTHPVSQSSVAEWKDSQGRSGGAEFPEIEVEQTP